MASSGPEILVCRLRASLFLLFVLTYNEAQRRESPACEYREKEENEGGYNGGDNDDDFDRGVQSHLYRNEEAGMKVVGTCIRKTGVLDVKVRAVREWEVYKMPWYGR